MRLSIWRASTACIALLMLAGQPAAPARAQQPTPITLAQSSQSFTFVPLYIAQTRGYFKEEGIDLNVVLIGGGPKAMTALIGGSAQFSASVLADGIMAHRKGRRDVRALAVLVNSFLDPFVMRTEIAKQRGVTFDSPFKDRVASLKGLKIGMTTPGSTSDLIIRYLMLTNGYNPDRDVDIVPTGGVDTQIAAISSGGVDVCSCLVPVDYVTISRGVAVRLFDIERDVPALRSLPYGTLYTTKSYADANPKIVEGFTRAVTKATMLIGSDPAAAKEATRPFFAMFDPAIYDAAWEGLLPNLPRDPEIRAAGYAEELDFDEKVLPPEDAARIPFEQVVDSTWVQRAKQALAK